MKKILKTLTVAAALFSAVTFNLAALESGFSQATAGTVTDDVAGLMDLVGWSDIKFDKVFGFVDINSTASGNLAAAFHVNGSNVLGIAWSGNLWAATPSNSFSMLYGWNTNAVQLNYTQIKNDQYTIDGTTYNFDADVNIFSFGAGYGKTVNDKFAFELAFNYLTIGAKIATYDTNISLVTAGAMAYYTLQNDAKIKSTLSGGYAGIFFNYENDITENDYSVNTINLGYSLEYKPSSSFTYGLKAAMPVSFTDAAVNVNFELDNGFSYIIQPEKFIFNMGLKTTLPSITFPDGADTVFGTFNNEFSAGLSIFATPAARIDLTTIAAITSGISLDEIWNQNFRISVRLSF